MQQIFWRQFLSASLWLRYKVRVMRLRAGLRAGYVDAGGCAA